MNDFQRITQVLHLWAMFFVYMKLTHAVQWSWWVVLLPLMAAAVLAVARFIDGRRK